MNEKPFFLLEDNGLSVLLLNRQTLRGDLPLL